MKTETRFNVAAGALLMLLLALVILLALHNGLAADEVEKSVVKAEENVVDDSYSTVAFVAMVAMFGYVIWTVLRADQGGAKSMPPARESSASDKSACR
jgi:hypothetical protein